MDINIKNNTIYPELLDWVKNDKHFSFARYNDGEWGIILEKQPHYDTIKRRWGIPLNELTYKLKSIVEKPLEYFVGIPHKLVMGWFEDIESVINPNIKPINSEIIHSRPFKEFKDFLELLKTKNTLLVGPKYLSVLNFFRSHTITPEKFVWDHTENLMSEIRQFINNNNDPIIIYSASIATNIMIDELYGEYKNSITQIDLGSTLDPHAGVLSRSGHRNYMNENGLEVKRVFKTNKRFNN